MYELTQSMGSLSVDEIIVYLRKSRSDSPEMSVEDVLKKHEEMIQDYANTHFGSPIPEKNIYREVVSGETIDSRPQVKIVLQKIESPQIKAVLIVEPQRLSRGDLEDCGRLINLLRYTNTMVLTLTHSFNLQEEYERKFFEMEITRGNDYLEYTKRILRRGRESSAAKGHYIGSVDPYGYRKIVIKKDGVNCHTLEIVPEEANVVRLIHEFYAYTPGGIGFTNIAHKLDSMNLKPKKAAHWTPAIISSILCNPLYLGLIRWDTRKVVKYINDGQLEKSRPRSSDAKYYKGLHEPIISQELYDACMARRGTNPSLRRNKALCNPFAGLLYCGTCGHAMSLKIYKNHNSVSQIMLCNHQSYCHTKSVLYSAFLERFISSMENTIHDFELALLADNGNAQAVNQSIVANLETRLKKLQEKDMRQKDAYEDGIYSKEEFLERNIKTQQEIASTITALTAAKETKENYVDYGEKIRRFRDCINALNDPELSATEKNQFLKSCVSKIIYYNNMESKAGVGRYVENVFSLEIQYI